MLQKSKKSSVAPIYQNRTDALSYNLPEAD